MTTEERSVLYTRLLQMDMTMVCGRFIHDVEWRAYEEKRKAILAQIERAEQGKNPSTTLEENG